MPHSIKHCLSLLRSSQHSTRTERGCVATIGNFDGVHVGHQAIIRSLAAKGEQLGLPVAVVLFEPQPREYFWPDQAPPRLTRLREKLAALAKLPIDIALLLRFNRQLSDLPPETFIEQVLVRQLRIRHLVVGDDFRFGRRREGNLALLREFGKMMGYGVADTESVQVGGHRVSSTLIREALAAGDMPLATEMLGRAYSLCGRISRGASLGQKIGFPTANMPMLRKKSPLQGVFAVTMSGLTSRPLPGVANVGVRPTIHHGSSVQLETHLFDFSEDIYGRMAEVHFHRKLRDERRFDTVQALTKQIENDVSAARDFFATVDTTNFS